MSKTGGDEEDEDECFHESLDRILSSTNSSCSPSPSSSSFSEEEVEDRVYNKAFNFSSSSPNYAPGCPLPIPNFPMGVFQNYDVWISEPSSVQERRMRLLRQMGLSRGPSLSRQKPPSPSSVSDSGGAKFGRSISSDRIKGGEISCSNGNPVSNPGMVRSKSDRATDQCSNHSNNSISSVFVCYSPEILSINSISSAAAFNDLNTCLGTFVNKHFVVKPRNSGDGSSPIANGNTISPNKPPSGKNCRTDPTRSNSDGNFNSSLARENGSGGVEEDLDCNVIVSVSDPACIIKNLDTGKEFMVKEVRGDGRQSTMEEFEMCVGHSPIVQELMRRQNVENGINKDNVDSNANGSGLKLKKKGSWLRSIKNVASSVTGHKDRRSSNEKDISSERGGQRSSSATDDSQDVSFHGSERIRVRQYGKSCKELTWVYKTQEIQAHNGSIWTIKFSLDGKYLASAGEYCVIHTWQVVESKRKSDLLLDKSEDGNLNPLFLTNGSTEPNLVSSNNDSHSEKKRRGQSSISRM